VKAYIRIAYRLGENVFKGRPPHTALSSEKKSYLWDTLKTACTNGEFFESKTLSFLIYSQLEKM
jgi:hypothetical protein